MLLRVVIFFCANSAVSIKPKNVFDFLVFLLLIFDCIKLVGGRLITDGLMLKCVMCVDT